MAMEWITAMDKRPCDRNLRDAELISCRLRRVEPLCRLPSSALQQLAMCGFYEDLEKGVTLFRAGEQGRFWYAVLGGSLEVRYHASETDAKAPVTLCNLSVGATFGESILHELPRDSTVVTKTTCELLRVEQQDFRLIWEKNKELMNDIITTCKLKNGFGSGVSPIASSPTKRPLSPDHPNPALPISESPSSTMSRMGWALRTLLIADGSSCLKDRKVAGKFIRKCAPGTELVDWLLNLSSIVHTRAQAAGMWQALLEEGVLSHVNKEQPFKDKCFLYRFRVDEDGSAGSYSTTEDTNAANEYVRESLSTLFQRGPDAILRMILRKPSHERTPEELELIFEELLHITALSHLSTSIKRELSSIIVFESHAEAGTILFNQGDEGRSWYILLKGSVDVVIHGKGTVATLKNGDDFGKLALINDAPRAATIVLKENNCHLLRVDKEHFNRILRDVEANTLRLQEHGKDVLVLERVAKQRGQHSAFKYTVMSGTPSKMLEHLLETRLGNQVSGLDPFLDDFLLTHIVFMPVVQLVDELANYFHCDSNNGSQTPEDREYIINFKKRVVQFMQKWVTAVRHAAFDEPTVCDFIEDLATEIEADQELSEETSIIHNVLTQMTRYQEDRNQNTGQKWKLPPNGQPICLFSGNATPSKTIIRPDDDIIFRVYCADHTYCTLRFPLHTTAGIIKACAADKLQLNRGPEDLVLIEVKSNGERSLYKDNDVSIPTSLSLNGRLFVSVKDHLDALTPLPEQEGPTEGIDIDLEILSTKEIAYQMTLFDWDLFWAVHEYELLYQTFGRHHFGKITANLDVFLRRFNELQFWIATEIVTTSSMCKRVGLLRKFIKLAAYCKEYQNLNAFFAITMGLSNMAVLRLTQTWEKIPSKFRKLFQEFEALIDPSRNHRAYRVYVGKLQPPVIPFMPLLLKDMTFAHEGNKTSLEGLVNFEKMHMMAQTMRTIRFCRSRSLGLEPPSPKSEGEVRSYISCLRVIDNQRVLTAMSQKIEPIRKV
ncbi:rap guanine nucleotide exchange factor 4 [Bactrocera neohumeralis]|uniref:rap guanine nucleotide exchange factor 4 n=2 Tax=Bactrocera tyroni species complex TaxID=98808 RepID=UPI001A9682D5|nr:rap guanine nucleotide exchange factor 4 isoform X1 [Bactrocera tryoni]XP_039969266.1 rap guanine nucleotide exchange factor 4 isoform X1 [Bactrocera tryoni]XP_039969267.1 rap guanine nucleotide exchange factor 4 isoform X1 [Bactrocera tryoni]XP_050325588.1 rap guanine nucleotide exchange factor 4 [Bactrocera neohumeralis]XP_050325589.1 rap guanine nucleotide exchange factor 4 [Bactrocera neohumeralis]XP_050325590.1 rap guanine nucleotide exchange factor 4 [Bactrocera neohumeralis]